YGAAWSIGRPSTSTLRSCRLPQTEPIAFGAPGRDTPSTDSMRLAAQGHTFASLAEVMAKANEEKSGDRLAGLAAADARERVAAKTALADVPLRTFVDAPLLPPESDELTRAFLNGLDTSAYSRIAGWTVGELRERLLADPPEELATLRPGLQPEMAAAVVKL